MTKRKIYLSGSFTGDHAKVSMAFGKVEKDLTDQGHEVITPLNFIDLENPDPKASIRQRIIELMNCDELVLMPGWIKSWSAMVERNVASVIKMPTRMLEEDQQEGK